MKKISRSLIKNINFFAILKIVTRKSGAKLADDLNISKTYVSSIENGRESISSNLIQIISNVLNIEYFTVLKILVYFETLNNEKIDDLLKYQLALFYLIKTLYQDLIIPDIPKKYDKSKILENNEYIKLAIIENIRLANGMSAKDIANLLDITTKYYSQLKKNLRSNYYIRLSTGLNYSRKTYFNILKLYELIADSDKSDEEKNNLFLLGILKITNPKIESLNDEIENKLR